MIDKNLTWRMAKNPNYLISDDLIDEIEENGNIKYKRLTLTIKDICQEDVSDMEAIKKGKAGATKKEYVVYWKEDYKPYIVHAKCVFENMAAAANTKLMAQWIGKQFTLYVEKGVRAFGQLTDAIRVSKTTDTAEKCYCKICGKEMNQSIYNGSMKKYGIALCSAECKELALKQNLIKE